MEYGNDFARNVLIFGVDKTSLSHTDNKKNKCLVLGKRPTEGIHDSVGAAENKVFILVKERQNFV